MNKLSLTPRQRIDWIDIAKAIGILAIVYGHTVTEGALYQYVFSFHVPLFFFLQGITFSIGKANRKTFGRYVGNKVFTLLLPYYCFALLSTVLIFVASKVIQIPDIFDSSKDLLINIMIGYCDANRPLWFLPCTFVISVFAFPVIRLSEKVRSRSSRIGILLAPVLFGCAALFLNNAYLNIRFLPYKAEGALFMMPFMLAGYIFMEFGTLDRIKELSTLKKCMIAVPLAAIGIILALVNGHISYISNLYGSNGICFYVSAFVTCVSISIFAMMLPKSKVFSFVGSSTLSILLMHKFPVLVFQILIPFVKLNIWISTAAGICATVISVVMCLIAQFVILRICPFVIGKRKRITSKHKV